MLAALLLVAAALSPLDAAIHASVALCPPPRSDEIVVCGRHDDGERSRYRSPIAPLYDVGDPRARGVARERYELLDYDGGGAGSCSATGANGMFGCGFKKHKAWATQRAGARDSRGPLYDK